MTNSNYDIWAIQHQPEEVYTALDGLENSQDNTLFTNCRSYLRVGERKLYVQFDTAFFNEEKERLILLMQNGLLTLDQFREILTKKQISYNEVSFMKTMPLSQTEMKEIWFARDRDVLTDAIQDSKRKEIDVCEYYPALGGRFELRYPTDEDSFVPLERQAIRGAMVLEDKIIVLMSNSNEKNVDFREAMKVLQENDMTPLIITDERELDPETLPKQYKKER